VLKNQPEIAVTFVENHDLRDPGRPIAYDKLLAYSYVLTHQGSPCVFWKDYFDGGLAGAGTPHGIAALVGAYRRYAGGGTEVLWVDDDLYVMQRGGFGAQPGLIYVLNNNGERWKGAWVSTRWRDITFRPVAWWGSNDVNPPASQPVFSDGRGQFWAPPRGYAVYAPTESVGP
jgi:alpha-amylase